jgi:hypothetical protein
MTEFRNRIVAATPNSPEEHMRSPRLSSIRFITILAAATLCADAPANRLAAQTTETVLREPRVRIGVADGDAAYLLFGARQAQRLSDGRIVVMNSGTSEIRIFDSRGRHVRTVGRRGGGPGEFAGLQRIGLIRGDTIMAYDVNLGRISVFSPAGDLVRSHNVQPFANNVTPRAAGFTSNGHMLAHTDFGRVFIPGEHRDTLTFGLLGPTGVPGAMFGRFPGEEYFILAGGGAAVRRPVTFGRNTYASARGDHVVIGSSDDFTIRAFDGSGRPLRTHTGERPPRPVQRSDVRAADAFYIDNMWPQMRGEVERRIAEFPHRLSFPAFEDLLVGADGSIWVRESAPPGASERRWSVYGADGALVRRVRGAGELEIVDAGADWVLAWQRDGDGVESILMFDLP